MRTRAVSSAPPFCPNEACEHHCAPTSSWRWLRAGFFSRRAAPCRIQRYRCVDCGRYFSEQTFRTTYWLRCPQLLEETCHRPPPPHGPPPPPPPHPAPPPTRAAVRGGPAPRRPPGAVSRGLPRKPAGPPQAVRRPSRRLAEARAGGQRVA